MFDTAPPNDKTPWLGADRRALIFSRFDEHALALARELMRRGIMAWIWDSGRIDRDMPAWVDENGLTFLAQSTMGQVHGACQFTPSDCVIFRQLASVKLGDIHNRDPIRDSYRQLAEGLALAAAFQTGQTSDYHAFNAARHKAFRRMVGFDTLPMSTFVVGDQPDLVLEWWMPGQGIWFKPLVSEGWADKRGAADVRFDRETSIVDYRDGARPGFPGVYQELATREIEVRAVISEIDSVAVALKPRDGDPVDLSVSWLETDWDRFERALVEVPEDRLVDARRLLKKLNLKFAVFDFSIMMDDWTCIDVEPFGDFLGLHKDADSRAITLIADVAELSMD